MKKFKTCPVCQSEKITEHLKVKDFFFTQDSFTLIRCEACNTIFTHPQPEGTELKRYYETPEYLSHNTKNNGILGKLYKALRNINIKNKYKMVTRFRTQGKILDIGCGTGELLHYFQHKGWTTEGIEPNEKARNLARSQYGLKIEDENYLNNYLPETFDVVSMWHVLEHVPDVKERMQQVKTILKKTGFLILALPNPDSPDATYYREFWAAYDVPRHLYHFNQEALSNLAERHGFKTEAVFPLKMDAYYISLLSEKYKTGRKNYLKAMLSGYRSNLKAKSKNNYSSLVYILRKKEQTDKN